VSEEAEFNIGAEVACNDGPCGALRRVVVDPVARAITHLVVEPKRGRNLGHLVPIDRVESSSVNEIKLGCTKTEFEEFEDAEETQLLPGANGEWGYGQGEMLSFPYYGLGGLGMGGAGMGGVAVGGVGMGGIGGMGVGGMGMGGMAMGAGEHLVTHDKVPVGEVEVRRGQHVHATDGQIGSVRGLVIDPTDHHVTHILLDEGHLWGKKEVSIPISAVTNVDDGVHIDLTKDAVRDLPQVEIHHDD
jgi:sporulation protein YlmC with PRC-barrel domain